MEGQNENDELYPIAVLIDELKVRGRSAPSIFPSPSGGEPTPWSKLILQIFFSTMMFSSD